MYYFKVLRKKSHQLSLWAVVCSNAGFVCRLSLPKTAAACVCWEILSFTHVQPKKTAALKRKKACCWPHIHAFWGFWMYFFPCLLARFVYSHLCNLRELNKDLEYTYLKFNEHVSLIFSIQFTEIAVCLNFINILFSFTIMFSIPLLLSSNVQIYYHGINCKTKKKNTWDGT